MNIFQIKDALEENYDLKIKSIKRMKNTCRIDAQDGMYCLKIIEYAFPHFIFIVEAMKHLQQSGFDKVPDIIKTVSGNDYISLGGEFGYLTSWVNGRECNYDNPIDVKMAAEKLGQLHNASCGFKVLPGMQPRIGWLKWIEVFETRRNEILSFKKRINEKIILSRVDEYYLIMMEKELQDCKLSISNLYESSYYNRMMEHLKCQCFCHHDYAHHNILVGKNLEMNIIDFDYCILDTPLHDLSSLMIRTMKNGKWNVKTAQQILEAYTSTAKFEIHRDDVEIMAAFMEFPQDYWQRGIQYYWEKKPWGEDFFYKRLKEYEDDKEDKAEFLRNFRNLDI